MPDGSDEHEKSLEKGNLIEFQSSFFLRYFLVLGHLDFICFRIPSLGIRNSEALVNLGAATRIILLGEMIKSEEAERIGLVDRVVPLNRLEAEAEALASKLMQMPPLALHAAKVAIHKGLGSSIKEGLQIEQDQFCGLFGTADQKEGMATFLEKRRPVFKGR